MGMVVNQYEVFLIDLDPTMGHDMQKTRPCLVLSPNEMNHHISTVIVAPMTTKSHSFPTRVQLKFAEKQGWIVLDQIRTIDKVRLVKKVGKIETKTIKKVKEVLMEMLID
ncbi:type II toxin-antitoxin system PemK/MazF family toxin [Treponema brennaborense]|uniref:mRNA interferase n=1 Tax=Treponema brennaborense (strain DSM 12168 / CIP 105900 / DD5/3) TaxID=906968 RepID=F4LLC1_TREBD|nr:type II toxin-antitoxin system PemK/MazF family toxin [Treponema brennaborense]AEE15599.1 transcriptional modulator of MazE/toxin, MazF [Treponema brennaborense DSM 12168]